MTTITNLKAYREAKGFHEMEKLTGGSLSFNFIYEELVNLDALSTDKEAHGQPSKLHSKKTRSNKKIILNS